LRAAAHWQEAAAQGHGPESCVVRQVGCLGLCGAGPMVSVEPGGSSISASSPRTLPTSSARSTAAGERIALDPQRRSSRASKESFSKTRDASTPIASKITSPPTAIWR
jgi:hypothetical protein